MKIVLGIVNELPVSVYTKEDLEHVRKIME